MSQYGVNKVATVILLDTSAGMNVPSSNGASHFERSKWIVTRILLRNMFAYETDEVGLLTFGVSGVKKLCGLKIPDWDMFKSVEAINIDKDDDGIAKNKRKGGNWAQSVISAVDFLEENCQGKRFKSKQVVILSNFTWSSPEITNRLETLITVINAKMLNVIVIGVDIKKESQDIGESPEGVEELVEFVSKLENGLTLSFEEVEEDVKFYQKKKKAKRLTKGMMKIGSQIIVPFKWMKITNEDTRLKFAVPVSQVGPRLAAFDKAYAKKQLLNSKQDDEGSPLKVPKLGDGTAQSANGTATLPSESHTSTADFGLDSRTSNDDISNIELRFTQDESRKTRFGATEVLLTYADMEAMKRKTGPPSCTFLGSVKSSRISRSMLVGDNVYVMVSDGTMRSQAQLTALINSLLTQNKYGLARRVACKDGKVSVGILYPVSDDLGKALYFVQLPLADWVMTVPCRPLPDEVDEPLVDAMNELIDAMSIEGRGRDLLLRDPNFQTRAAIVEGRARNDEESFDLPEHITDLFDPYPEQRKAGQPIIDMIMNTYSIPSPPPDVPAKSKITTEETVVEKELTQAEEAEVAELQDLITKAPDSLGLYEDVSQQQSSMDTEEVFKLL